MDNRSRDILIRFSKLSTEQLKIAVHALENNENGQEIVRQNPNRKLYAVLEPNRDECLERLRVLLEHGNERLIIQAGLGALFGELGDCLDKHFQNGEISKAAMQEICSLFSKEGRQNEHSFIGGDQDNE